MKSLFFLRDIEVAHRYNISRPTIWRWVKQGKFPKPLKLAGGSSRWKLKDLENWEQIQSEKQDNRNHPQENN